MWTIAAAVCLLGTVLTPPPAAQALSSGGDSRGGTGATVPYREIEAEDATTNGTVIGPSYTQGFLPNEASGRRAVTLDQPRQTIDFTLPVAADSAVVRFSIPDTADGSPYTTKLHLAVAGTPQPDLILTNEFAWYADDQTVQGPTHRFDETHQRFDRTYPAGTTVRLEVPAGSATPITVDLVDFENVPDPLTPDADAVVITDLGADPTGELDATESLRAAIRKAGSSGSVFIPEGTFRLSGKISVDDIAIRGAGMWHTTLTGTTAFFYGQVGGGPAAENVELSDFAIFGTEHERDDNRAAEGIGGVMMDSRFSRLWIEHVKVGAWMKGPSSNLEFRDLRVRNTLADGVALAGGVSDSSVENSTFRNTGDDSIAPVSTANRTVNLRDTFTRNTIQNPARANGIALYGGHETVVQNNVIVDAGAGSGIHLGQRYEANSAATVSIRQNTIRRSGEYSSVWQNGTGALYFYAEQYDIRASIDVDGLLIEDSPFSAIQFQKGHDIEGVTVRNATIRNTGTFALQAGASGYAIFENVSVTGIGGPAAVGVPQCATTFQIILHTNVSGLDGRPLCIQPGRYPPSSFPDTHDPFTMTAPMDGTTFEPNSYLTFRGTGAPRATVAIAPSDPSLATVTTTVGADGTWSVRRYMGNGSYVFVAEQSVQDGRSSPVRVGPVAPPPAAPKPLAVTAPDAGSDHRATTVTFRGVGTAGEVITLRTSNFESADVTGMVRNDGTWTIPRYLGTGKYVFEISQSNGETVSDLRINQPAA